MGTFFDSFLPAVTGELGKVGPAMVQGQIQGHEASRQLALLEAQIRQTNAQAQFQEAHAKHYGQRLSPQLQALQFMAQHNPQEYTKLLSDPNFFMQYFGHQKAPMANTRPTVAAPGSMVLLPNGERVAVPNRPVTMAEGSAVLMPGQTELTQAPNKPRTVSPGGAVIQPDTGEVIFQAPSKGTGPGSGSTLAHIKGELVGRWMQGGKLNDREMALIAKETGEGDPKLTATQEEQIRGGAGMLAQIDDMMRLYNEAWVGPMDGRTTLMSVTTGVGLKPGMAEFVAQNQSLLNQLLKLRSGAAVTDQEFQRMLKELPYVTDSPQSYLEKTVITRRNITNLINLHKQRTKDISSTTGPAPGKFGEVESQLPPGPNAQTPLTKQSPMLTRPTDEDRESRFNAAYDRMKSQHPDWPQSQIIEQLLHDESLRQ